MPDPDVTTPDPAPAPAEQSPAEPTGLLAQVRRLISQVSESLKEILTLGAGFTLLGFVVVNLYLLQVTAIHGFNIVAGQYVAAAVLFFLVSLVLALPLGWLYRRVMGLRLLWTTLLAVVLFAPLLLFFFNGFEVEGVIAFLAGGSPGLLGYILFALIFPAYVTLLMSSLIRLLQLQSERMAQPAALADRLMAWFLKGYAYTVMLLVIPLFIVSFFLLIYAEVPHALGGGKPSPAVLILAGDADAETLNLRMDAAEPLHTAPLEILAELTDGLLIRAEDEQGAIAVLAVKHDSIRALLSVPEALLPTPAPAATVTSAIP